MTLDESFVRQQLRLLLRTHGKSLLTNPRRTEALLRDTCPGNRREVNVLVAVLRERAAEELLFNPMGLDRSLLIPRLVKRLSDVLGLSEHAAQWAVETWDDVLWTPIAGDAEEFLQSSDVHQGPMAIEAIIEVLENHGEEFPRAPWLNGNAQRLESIAGIIVFRQQIDEVECILFCDRSGCVRWMTDGTDIRHLEVHDSYGRDLPHPQDKDLVTMVTADDVRFDIYSYNGRYLMDRLCALQE